MEALPGGLRVEKREETEKKIGCFTKAGDFPAGVADGQDLGKEEEGEAGKDQTGKSPSITQRCMNFTLQIIGSHRRKLHRQRTSLNLRFGDRKTFRR